eukprot:CAMPEP_0172909542 /NCGR_PEP_ID=MMETSP1075-20121228/182888_1 /TAXON_ID=2916 /ORGANISM="Ceratium fusus, Strain PA161109" /LENGTH=176 /DNA_ID=CAMNT_0013767517 /DNA_START=246 /DNA_END=776 /DNA_ORIENTATION=+
MAQQIPGSKSADAKAEKLKTQVRQDSSSESGKQGDAAMAPSAFLAASGSGQEDNGAIVSLDVAGLEPAPENLGRDKFIVSSGEIQRFVKDRTEVVQSKLQVTEVKYKALERFTNGLQEELDVREDELDEVYDKLQDEQQKRLALEEELAKFRKGQSDVFEARIEGEALDEIPRKTQ